MTTVLFACVQNAGRSQMAAAFFNALANPARARAISAGTQPAGSVHPEVVAVMKDVGIDLGQARTTRLTADLARQVQMLVTLGCGDDCPVAPGTVREDWPINDPKGQQADEVRRIRNEIRHRVEILIDAHGWR